MNDQERHWAKDGICVTCKTPAPCHEIAAQAGAEFRQLAKLLPIVTEYLEPHRHGDNIGHAPPKSTPPMSLVASDLLAELGRWAEFYATVLADETPDYKPATTDAGRLHDVGERYGHFTTAADRTALDYCDQAHELTRKVRGLIERPPPPRFMGPCTATECAGDVYLAPGDVIARCRTCDTGHGLTELREQLWRAFEARLVRRQEIAPAVRLMGGKIATKTVHTWIYRGRLVPVMRDPEFFRLADAFDLAGVEVAA